jgi:hypothetical protein
MTTSGKDNPRKLLPSKRRTIKTPLPRNPKRTSSTFAPPSATESLFDKYSLAWMWTLIHLQGGLKYQGHLSVYLPCFNVGGKPDGHINESKQLSPAMQHGLVTQCKEEILQRFKRLSMPTSFPRKAPAIGWKVAFGSRESLDDQASFYVETIDFEEMKMQHKPIMILAIVICNLRNYYDQTKTKTVDLVSRRYNRRYGTNWSKDDIALIWDLVEGYAPSMWLYDSRYRSKKRSNEIQHEVKEILSRLTPGGRILVTEMQKIVKEWDPTLEVTPRELGDAMHAITGSASKVSNGKSYYFGFQLPFSEDAPYDGTIPSSLQLLHAREALRSSGDKKPDYDPIAFKKLDKAIRASLFNE